MQPGYFSVSVTFAREGAPAAAALVAIRFPNGGFTTRVTDASGMVGPFSVDCPNAELSRDPYYEGDIYASVDVIVTYDRFRSVEVIGAQVFAGIHTTIPINIEPLTLGRERNPTKVYLIPPHRISDITQRNLDKPDGSERILDFVSIPEYVTVHLGTPTSNAQNVTVSFRNYIKNVCCSEIYPTWPNNSIRANIYCQISLVLNRIFTEWYRSRGYQFDITNSTSYDQYFVYGRNIHDNISEIVDGIFDTYIRRGSDVAPFYAEYCNGTTATCPGLSQWGTVTLAEQGYTPIQILRYYYGSQVALYEAPIATQPPSYPGTALRLGSRGNPVITIQTFLQRIRRNYPLIPSVGNIDGIFGSLTEAAVRQFQSIFSLTPDGIVGKATWYKLSYIYTAVAKLAELGSEGITTPNIVSPVPTVVLREGSTGGYVNLAQYLVSVASDFYTELVPISIDGIYGPLTTDAIRDFQRMRGLNADGIVGPLTWNELYLTFYSVFNSITPSSSNAYPGTALRVGSSGDAVALMQRYLSYISYFFPQVSALTIDSVFGQATRNSVIQFQTLFGLAADGVIGRDTWNRIVSVYNTVVSYAG